MHGGMGKGPQQRMGGFDFLPLLLDDLFEDDDEPEHEPAIEVIKVV